MGKRAGLGVQAKKGKEGKGYRIAFGPAWEEKNGNGVGEHRWCLPVERERKDE